MQILHDSHCVHVTTQCVCMVSSGVVPSFLQRRFQMHEKAVLPFLDYFKAGERVVTVDVSSGATEAIWDKVHEVFTALHLQAWRPVNSVLVFAMGKHCHSDGTAVEIIETLKGFCYNSLLYC